MTVTVLEKVPEDPEIVLAWNELVMRTERPEVFFTHQWALAASRAFSDILCPLIFLVYESGRLDGVAALAANRESPGAAFFLTASTADYCDIISEPQTRELVLAAVLEEMKKRSLQDLVLANVPAESHTLRAIRALAKPHRFHLHERPAYECGVVSLGDAEQRQAVLQSVMRKEKEKRGLKKLGQLGPVHVTHSSGDSSELETALRSIVVAQISRFFTTNRLSPLIRPQRRAFLMELGRLMSSAGWLKVSQLEVNGTPIAWNFGFRFLDSWFWYLPTFEAQYEESSPGSCLLRLLIEEACADPSVNRLDMGLGDEAYKARFSNDSRLTRQVELSGNTRRYLVNVGRYRLATFVRRFPVVDKQLRSGRELFHTIKGRFGKSAVVAVAARALAKAKRSVASEDEVAFFEAPPMTITMNASEAEGAALSPLSWEAIATAAMNSAEDEETLKYLARSAQRLKRGRATGYFLHGRDKQPSHFLWVDRYDGFHLSEINSTLKSADLKSADPEAAMIFDCWTPVAHRGQGNYATAIRLTAAYLQKQNRQVWIFSGATNESSIRGILKAGFVYSFSLVKHSRLLRATVSRCETATYRHTVKAKINH